MASRSICPDCGGPKYRYAVTCNGCKAVGERNAMFGRRHSDQTRELLRQRALEREQKPRTRRSTTVESGRDWARRWYPMPDLCEDCHTAPPLDRHHVDGNTNNNAPENIAFLCRRCHQKRDGRHERLKHEIPSMGGKARAS
jgi:hypothetical protein